MFEAEIIRAHHGSVSSAEPAERKVRWTVNAAGYAVMAPPAEKAIAQALAGRR